jgi:BirA family biotin operon repressor/biotin-[acetyl-CoA-carboxylase] ligase
MPILGTSMQRRLQQWDRGGGFETIRADWIARAARLHQDIRLLSGDEQLEGRFEGIDQDGRLILHSRDGGRRVLNAGDVTSAMPNVARLREGAAL